MPIDYLPAVVFEELPELAAVTGGGEPRSDCGACVLVPPQLPVDHPRALNPETRCCTYYPDLPNFLVGRILARDTPGTAVVREQLARPDYVSAWGIEQPDDVRNPTGRRFGRDLNSRCPYWVGGDHACGIWHDRNAVCRTWFCKHEQGGVGRERWQALKRVLGWIETALANICVEAGDPPEDGAAIATWIDWFRWCAEHVERIDREALAAERDDELRVLLGRWAALAGAVPVLPDVVVPVVVRSAVHDGALCVDGYSSFDGVDGDAALLELFVALDGQRSWRDAVDRAGLEARAGAALVRELHRIDLLQPPEQAPAAPVASDELPELLVPATALPIVFEQRVWLQGVPRLGSLLAPRSVFELLSRLDGQTSWRRALADAQTIDPALDAELVARLFQIGAVVAAQP